MGDIIFILIYYLKLLFNNLRIKKFKRLFIPRKR